MRIRLFKVSITRRPIRRSGFSLNKEPEFIYNGSIKLEVLMLQPSKNVSDQGRL